MKKFIPYLIILSLTFTSCVEIIEEITINKDQSGSLSYRLETGELGSIINSFSGFLENDFEIQIKEKVAELANKLIGIEGIENVNYNVNPKTGEFELKADFDNSKSLNKALYQAFGYEKNIFTPGYIKISKHKFKRNNISPWIQKYLDEENIQLPNDQLLNFITYQTRVNLPEKAKSIKPEIAKTTKEKKTVTITYHLAEIINNKTSLKYSIKY